MQGLEDKNGHLKVDSLADWKPMELPKDWSDVVTPPGSGHQSNGSVLNSLKPLLCPGRKGPTVLVLWM